MTASLRCTAAASTATRGCTTASPNAGAAVGVTFAAVRAPQFAVSNAGDHVKTVLRAKGPRAQELTALPTPMPSNRGFLTDSPFLVALTW
jgi:hypothetical protein